MSEIKMIEAFIWRAGSDNQLRLQIHVDGLKGPTVKIKSKWITQARDKFTKHYEEQSYKLVDGWRQSQSSVWYAKFVRNDDKAGQPNNQ